LYIPHQRQALTEAPEACFVVEDDTLRDEPDLVSLDLTALSSGMRGLSAVTGAYYAEACAVCLEERGHGEECTLSVTGTYSNQFRIIRPDVTDQIRASHGDYERATEDGACGLSILAVSKLTNLEVLHQSRKGTGFDYALSPRGGFLFRDCVRLEVTGIRNDPGDAEIERRVIARKERFAKFGDQGIPPAIIVVIEFGRPIAHVEQV
jgi:hypothetical protein